MKFNLFRVATYPVYMITRVLPSGIQFKPFGYHQF